MKILESYKKENDLPNMLRFNVINARESDLVTIYSIDMNKRDKAKMNKDMLSNCKENLLLNFIYPKYSKDEKVVIRKIYENEPENDVIPFTKEDINLLKYLYESVIKKYINADLCDINNIKNFKKDFIMFDEAHTQKDTNNEKEKKNESKKDEKNNKKANDESELKKINRKFIQTPFYIRNYNKNDITLEDLNVIEYLCYLNLILLNDNYFLHKIQSLNQRKNTIFKKYSNLSNKDKSLILVTLLANEKKNKSNYEFKYFYDLPENSCYIQSELFFRKTVSKLNDNSSLLFLYLQLNFGSGYDYIKKSEYYKIRMIPLIEIKYHLLVDSFHPYFFTYDSNNNILALYNVNTQILSFNESEEIGYVYPNKLSEINDKNNMIKMAFLKFHEHAHTKFQGDYDDKIDPRYLFNDNFELIDNLYKNNDKNQVSLDVGESGNALEFFIFNDYLTLEKLMKSTEDLSPLNNIDLLTKDNFNELRELVKKLTEDVKLLSPYDKTNELSKKYEEKIKNSNLQNKSISELRLYDLDIDELYKINYS